MLVEKCYPHPLLRAVRLRNMKRHFVPDGTKNGERGNVSTNILFLTEQAFIYHPPPEGGEKSPSGDLGVKRSLTYWFIREKMTE